MNLIYESRAISPSSAGIEMSRYVINILASRDLSEIADYFTETNIEVGEHFFRENERPNRSKLRGI